MRSGRAGASGPVELGGAPSQYVDVFTTLEAPRTLYCWESVGPSSRGHDPIIDTFLEDGGRAENPRLVIMAWSLCEQPPPRSPWESCL